MGVSRRSDRPTSVAPAVADRLCRFASPKRHGGVERTGGDRLGQTFEIRSLGPILDQRFHMGADKGVSGSRTGAKDERHPQIDRLRGGNFQVAAGSV